MKYIIHNHDKLTLLGQDAVSILIHEVIKDGIIEDFCNELASLGHTDVTKDMVFEKEFDFQFDSHYVLYHIISMGATFLEFHCSDFIVKRKLFIGYENDILGIMAFIKGLENALSNFKQKGEISSLQKIEAEHKPNNVEYHNGPMLGMAELPYFSTFGGCSGEDLMRALYEFGYNMAYIRKPKNPQAINQVFMEKTEVISDVSRKILGSFFIAN
jgi:hypothetical protein